MRIQEQYYLSHDGEQTGPFGIGQLTSMWASGAVNNETFYWNEDSSEWRSIAELNALLSPKLKSTLPPLSASLSTPKALKSTPSQPAVIAPAQAQQAKKPGCRWIGIGCLLVLLLPIGFLILIAAIGSMLPNSPSSSATTQASDNSTSNESSERPLQTDRQVIISDEWIQNGFADFALLNLSDIPKYCGEYDALQEKCKTDLEPYQHIDPSQIQTPDDVDRLIKQPTQRIIDNFKAQIKTLDDQYVSEKRGLYVDLGTYKITDYFDHEGKQTDVYTYADGVFSTHDKGKCYVSVDYKGAIVYLHVWCQPQLNPPLEFDPNHDVKKDVEKFLDNAK